MSTNIKTDPVKTVLTITVGFLVIFMVSKQPWALWVALIAGLVGVVSPYLTKMIDWLWMKLAWLLSFIVPNIVLSAVFYLFLFPIALLSRLFGQKDPLRLQNNSESVFVRVEKSFDKSSFEKPW